MPHYIFVCQDCGKEFEKVLHIDELNKTPVRCPACDSAKIEQTVGGFSAVTSKKS